SFFKTLLIIAPLVFGILYYLVSAGNGLKNIWIDKEGTDIALWLNEQGITCMVVKYRTNHKDDTAWKNEFVKWLGYLYK
ncbi:MAG: hypothetical protein R6W78_03810, partial [Bacteroidales bacterium]